MATSVTAQRRRSSLSWDNKEKLGIQFAEISQELSELRLRRRDTDEDMSCSDNSHVVVRKKGRRRRRHKNAITIERFLRRMERYDRRREENTARLLQTFQPTRLKSSGNVGPNTTGKMKDSQMRDAGRTSLEIIEAYRYSSFGSIRPPVYRQFPANHFQASNLSRGDRETLEKGRNTLFVSPNMPAEDCRTQNDGGGAKLYNVYTEKLFLRANKKSYAPPPFTLLGWPLALRHAPSFPPPESTNFFKITRYVESATAEGTVAVSGCSNDDFQLGGLHSVFEVKGKTRLPRICVVKPASRSSRVAVDTKMKADDGPLASKLGPALTIAASKADGAKVGQNTVLPNPPNTPDGTVYKERSVKTPTKQTSPRQSHTKQ
ncbi:uncharacterized protein [Ptychodera flava]|uniref:uncharacterized protein n=1 Tax=Ptychodera flava TaxID=63121 RepID=UPI00396A083E